MIRVPHKSEGLLTIYMPELNYSDRKSNSKQIIPDLKEQADQGLFVCCLQQIIDI